MAFNVAVEDSQLKGFSNHAAAAVEEFTKKYAIDLIQEANRLEAGGSVSGPPEVTAAMVHDAEISIRRGIIKPKRKNWLLCLKIASAVFSAAAGIMYNDTKMQDGAYLLLFICVISVAIVTVTLSTLME